MFSAARLRLTLWYLAVLATIVVLLSVALYDVLLRLQQAEAQAQQAQQAPRGGPAHGA